MSNVTVALTPPHPSPPYPPTVELLGGAPSILPDVPICAVFALLFLAAAIRHVTILVANNKVEHKWKMSIPITIFCGIRVFSSLLRIIWATRPTSVNLAIAAQVFVAAGILILFILNHVFGQRLVRALQPRIGWSTPYGVWHYSVIAAAVVTLLLIISFSILSFFTLDLNILRVAHDVQIYCETFFLFLAFLPALTVTLALILPRRKPIDSFGTGAFSVKVALVVGVSLLLTVGASYRAGTLYLNPVPLSLGILPGYLSKPAFYCVDFVIDLIVVFLWAIFRMDQRFYVPDKSKGSYYKHPERGSKFVDMEKAGSMAHLTGSTVSLRTKSMETAAESIWTLPTTELDFDRRSGKWSLKHTKSMISSMEDQRRVDEWTMLGRDGELEMFNRTAELQRKWGGAAAAARSGSAGATNSPIGSPPGTGYGPEPSWPGNLTDMGSRVGTALSTPSPRPRSSSGTGSRPGTAVTTAATLGMWPGIVPDIISRPGTAITTDSRQTLSRQGAGSRTASLADDENARSSDYEL